VFEQYADSFQSGNIGGLDHGQMLEHVIQFMQKAPPGMQQGVFQQLFSQMAPQQRQQFAQQAPPEYGMDPNNPAQMAQGFQQMGQQQPDMIGQLLGPSGLVSSPTAKMALAGIAGLAANQMLQRR
jgi:hypothetical protein